MFQNIFNIGNYYFNPWTIPLFVVGVMVFAEGFFVYTKSKNSLVNRIFFLWSITGALWLLGFGLVQSSKSLSAALYWYKHVALLGVVFISLVSYMFSLSWLVKDFSKKKRVIAVLFLILTMFYLSSFWGNLFVKEMRIYFWGYYPFFGILGRVFMIVWVGLFIQTLVNFFRAYKHSEGIKRKQIFYLFMGVPIVYIAVIDFVPIVFGVEVYPFGYIPTFIAISMFAYAIIRYKAMEVDTVIHRTIMWILTSGLLLVPIGILLFFARIWLSRLSWIQLTLTTTLLFYIFLYYYLRLQPEIDHLFRRRKYDYQTILGKIAEKIAAEININDIARQLLTEVCEIMYLSNSIFYVASRDEQSFMLIGRRGYQDKDGIRQRSFLEIFDKEAASAAPLIKCEENPAFRWLSRRKEVLEKQSIEIDPQYEPIKKEALDWFRQQEVEVFVPLVFEQKVVGVLGLGKKENLKQYAARDIELLRKLGQEAGVTAFNALHYKDVIEKERLEDDMAMGREIQMSLLPRKIPDVAGLEISGWMQSAREIGGDYYDFVKLPGSENMRIVIGDVSGKGVAAGLMMTMVKMAVHALSRQTTSPREVLSITNSLLHEQIAGQKFMTLLYLIWKAEQHSFTYSSAGHEHILLYRNQGPATAGRTTTGVVEAILSGGFMLGMIPDIDRFLEEIDIQMKPGDKMLLYTDGVTEALNNSGERFGLGRLKESLYRNGSSTVSVALDAVKNDIFAFIGEHEQYDDITLVVMEAT